MSSFQPPPPPANRDLGEFLKECLDQGIRPPGKNFGKPWERSEFARAAGLSEKQVSNYLKNEHPPHYPTALEKALFGDDQEHLSEWRRELRAALKRTKERKAKAKLEANSDKQGQSAMSVPESPLPSHGRKLSRVLYENGPTVVGGVGIAQGLVHLAWILSEFFSEQRGELLQSPWAYADCVFGFGGVLFGLGCIGVRHWARIGGICFCLLALLCSYLWFTDEINSDVSRVVFAMNLLSPPFASGALCYLLFGSARWTNSPS
jgi:hypothetical protein